MDGASYFTVFFRILMPLMKPAIVTVIIIRGVNIYNDFSIPFLYMNRKGIEVISTSLFNFQGTTNRQTTVIYAGIIISMIPTLIVFLLLQKQIYSGLTSGAVKE